MRRYAPIKPSQGTQIPADMRLRVLTRDGLIAGGCVGWRRLPGECAGGLELDHVRASHGMGLKSATEDGNLVSMCGAHHRYKTANGRTARPILLDYLASVPEPEDPHAAHVDRCPGCPVRVTA